MGHDTANAYLRTRVLTAAPEELRLMLLDGAIRFATQGRDGLTNKDYEASYNGFTQCRNILVELMTTIRSEVDADLAARVRSILTFMLNTLIEASFEKSPAKVDSVIKLLEYERETWVMAMQKLAAERRGPTATLTAEAPAGTKPAISLQA